MTDLHPALIDRLPAELLEKIFILTHAHGSRPVRAPSAASLSQVCRRWREISLGSGCRCLWSSALPYRSPEWTELCLKRCGSTPPNLNLVYDKTTIGDAGYQASVSLALAPLDRAHSLRLTVESDLTADVIVSLDNAFKNLSQAGTPSLDLSEISVVFGENPAASIGYVSHRVILHLLGSQLPPFSRLRTLSLIRCRHRHLPSSSNLFSISLRSLTLHDTRFWRTIDGMMRLLQNIPFLETLEIKSASEQFNSLPSTPPAPRSIPFPNMRRLLLEGSWQENIVIFSWLAIPPTAHLTIGSNNDAYPDFDPSNSALFESAAEVFRAHFASALSRGAHYDEPAIAADFEMFTVSASPASATAETADHTVGTEHCDLLPAHLQLSVPWTDDPDVRQRLLNIFSTLPIFTMARTLHLDPFLWQYYPSMIAVYTNVRSLKLESSVEASLDDHGIAEQGALFPALTCVCFIGVDLSAEVLPRLVDQLLVTHSALQDVGFSGCRLGGKVLVKRSVEEAAQRFQERGITTSVTNMG